MLISIHGSSFHKSIPTRNQQIMRCMLEKSKIVFVEDREEIKTLNFEFIPSAKK